MDIRQFGNFEPERSEANRSRTFDLAAEGKLKPAIACTFPLEQFAEAMDMASNGQEAGRIVLMME